MFNFCKRSCGDRWWIWLCLWNLTSRFWKEIQSGLSCLNIPRTSNIKPKKNIYIYQKKKFKIHLAKKDLKGEFTTRKSSYCNGFFCCGCKNCHYMSGIAVLFWPAAVDEIYCGISLDHYNKSSLFWHTTTVLYKPPQYTCFSIVRHSYSGAP